MGSEMCIRDSPRPARRRRVEPRAGELPVRRRRRRPADPGGSAARAGRGRPRRLLAAGAPGDPGRSGTGPPRRVADRLREMELSVPGADLERLLSAIRQPAPLVPGHPVVGGLRRLRPSSQREPGRRGDSPSRHCSDSDNQSGGTVVMPGTTASPRDDRPRAAGVTDTCEASCLSTRARTPKLADLPPGILESGQFRSRQEIAEEWCPKTSRTRTEPTHEIR